MVGDGFGRVLVGKGELVGICVGTRLQEGKIKIKIRANTSSNDGEKKRGLRGMLFR
jgi:hypothetical protein